MSLFFPGLCAIHAVSAYAETLLRDNLHALCATNKVEITETELRSLSQSDLLINSIQFDVFMLF